MNESVGIIETHGYTAAIQAADAAVKSAKIRLGQSIKIGGGKVSIIIRGDVAAVKAGVEAGVKAASRIGRVESEVIIPRPSDKLLPVFPLEVINEAKK
jgi:ethanolamine utilization protein EutM